MPLTVRHLKFALWSAGANWLAWKADFEFGGQPEQLPVLNDEDRFKAFCGEYGVPRAATTDQRQVIRTWLRTPPNFTNAIGQGAVGIADLADVHQEHLGGRQLSFFSKLAAFARPTQFMAYDNSARIGLAKVRNEPEAKYDHRYIEYSAAIDEVWHDNVGREIRAFIGRAPPPVGGNRAAFGKRMLDVYLMLRGGRWPNVLL